MLVVPLALIIITAGLFQGGLIKSTFFPAIPFDFFNVNIAFTPGSGEKQTYDYLARFEDAMWELNDEIKEEFKKLILVNHFLKQHQIKCFVQLI